MTTSKHINFAEVAALAAQAPARVKGIFTAEITYTQTEDSPVEIMKGIEIKATTLKAAIKEAGQMVKNFRNAFNPDHMMLFFYLNGVCVGTMSYYCEIGNIRCDFSGLAVSNAVKEEAPETYDVCADGEYFAEEDDAEDNNVIATVSSLDEAKEIAQAESESNRNVMTVCRSSDHAVVATFDNTEKPAEPTHAAHLLGIYVDNDSFIYENYTQKAIDGIVNDGLSPDSTEIQGFIKNAVRRASWQVEKYDGIKPTPADIEHEKRSLTAYIIEEAQYIVKTA